VATIARPVTRTGGGEVIDMAAWKELKGRNQALM
jgi:hypothetical protein